MDNVLKIPCAPREMETFWHYAKGLTRSEIADVMGIQETTVDKNIAAWKKTGASNKAEAAMICHQEGYFEYIATVVAARNLKEKELSDRSLSLIFAAPLSSDHFLSAWRIFGAA